MKRKGFTLVEMLVAIAIFAIFMGVLITSYVSLVKGFRGTEDYRILYADARYVFDTIIENARNSNVYGCDDAVGVDKPNMLSFCSTDGVKRVNFEYTEPVVAEDGAESETSAQNGFIEMSVGEKLDALSPYAEYFPGDTVRLNSDSVNVKSFSFKVFPATDPFSGEYNVNSSYQPVVIVDAVFEKVSASGSTYELPLHTAISLRTYK